MATRYVMPPSYRAGRASPSVGGVRDILSFLDYLTRQQQEEQAVSIEDARYYNRQMAQERQDIRAEEREEQRRLREEQRRFGKGGTGGTISQEETIRSSFRIADDKLAHNKGLKARYDIDDLAKDAEGYYQVKPGGLSREAKTADLLQMEAIIGEKIPGGYGSPSYLEARMAYSEGATSRGPESTFITTLGEDDYNQYLYNPSGDPFDPTNIDRTPGVFSQEDMSHELSILSEQIREKRTPGDEGLISDDALERAYVAGVGENKLFQQPKDVLSMESTIQSMEAKEQGMELTDEQILNMRSNRFRSKDKDVAEHQLEAETYLNEVFQGVYNKIFTVEDDVTKVMGGITDAINSIDDEALKDAAKFLFMMGNNTLEPGHRQPLPYTDKHEWLAKFIYLDGEGRGGAPSMARRIMHLAGMGAQYDQIKQIIGGTHPTQKQGKFLKDESGNPTRTLSPVYSWTVSPARSIAAHYEDYRTSMHGDYEQDAGWKQFQFSEPFMMALDEGSSIGLFNYGYSTDKHGRNIVSLNFPSVAKAEKFLDNLKIFGAEYDTFIANWLDTELIEITPQ